jgi:hypothetical protein
MIAALFVAFGAILLLWWVTYTIRTFWRVLIGLSRATAAIAAMLWIVARALWDVAGAALERPRRPALRHDDQTNVIPFRKRG